MKFQGGVKIRAILCYNSVVWAAGDKELTVTRKRPASLRQKSPGKCFLGVSTQSRGGKAVTYAGG